MATTPEPSASNHNDNDNDVGSIYSNTRRRYMRGADRASDRTDGKTRQHKTVNVKESCVTR